MIYSKPPLSDATRSVFLGVVFFSLSILPLIRPSVVHGSLLESTPTPNTIGQHLVRPGDTLYCLARTYGVHPKAIAQANNLNPVGLLSPGQLLNIPAVQWVNISSGPVCAAQFKSPFPGWSPVTPLATATTSTVTLGLHVVQKGETIYCIGRAYMVRPTAITRANALVPPFRLYPGQVLNIPTVLWAPVPAGPVCQAQFSSPFVNTTITPTDLAPGSVPGATVTFTPTRGGLTKTPLPTRTEPPKP